MDIVLRRGGEYFDHSNIHTPQWLGWFLQRPKHHTVHHQLGARRYNFGDLTVWDRMFDTFKEAPGFAEHCGFPGSAESRLADMLRFKDVYDHALPAAPPPHPSLPSRSS
ncbi:sterol desaturase family protein [uncultured Ramlibacter sp.]|uniref:sterol desaturase family protein n=1 Tax=uncultured Ramlibacter sp. TaxID=260755 RepID=UPI0026186BFB|nr:sterol desaturase family protein [uncultured Ramlibacter sp.]